MTKLLVKTYDGPVAIEMPNATSVRYAAMRAAEELGYDPTGADWRLMDPLTLVVIPEDELAATLDGQLVLLAVLHQPMRSRR